MRKLILILFGLLLAVVVSAQSQRVYNQNIQINKESPLLDLQGLGAKIYLDGAISGTATLQPPAVAGATVHTLPSTTGTLVNATDVSSTYAPIASPAFTGSVPTSGGIPMSRVYSDTMSVSAGVLRTKATTITTEPYSVQIFSSGGKDITHAVADSVALDGGVYKLYVYSTDAITGAKIKILY